MRLMKLTYPTPPADHLHTDRDHPRTWQPRTSGYRRSFPYCRWRVPRWWSAYPVSTPRGSSRSSYRCATYSSSCCSRRYGSPDCRSSHSYSRSRCHHRDGSNGCSDPPSASFHRHSSGWYLTSSVRSDRVGSTSPHYPPCCSGSPSARNVSCR